MDVVKMLQVVGLSWRILRLPVMAMLLSPPLMG
jgi:hypothetical protein